MDSSAEPNQDGNAKPPEVEPTAEADTSNPPAPPSPTMEQQDSIADPPHSTNKPPSPVQLLIPLARPRMMTLLLQALHTTPLETRLLYPSILLRMNLLP